MAAETPVQRRRIPRRALYAYAAGLGVCGVALIGAGVYEGEFAGKTGQDIGTISGGPLVGKSAPAFSLKSPAGHPVALAPFRGKPLLLNFWATWCVPCRQELPALQQFATAQQGRWSVLGIDELEGGAPVATFAASLGVRYALALDTDGAIGQQYRVQGLPTSFLIDAQGVVRQTQLGPLDAATLTAWEREMRG